MQSRTFWLKKGTFLLVCVRLYDPRWLLTKYAMAIKVQEPPHKIVALSYLPSHQIHEVIVEHIYFCSS